MVGSTTPIFKCTTGALLASSHPKANTRGALTGPLHIVHLMELISLLPIELYVLYRWIFNQIRKHTQRCLPIKTYSKLLCGRCCLKKKWSSGQMYKFMRFQSVYVCVHLSECMRGALTVYVCVTMY